MKRVGVLMLLVGCGKPAEGPTFQEAVKTVYAPCEAEPIRLRAAEANLQLAFSACGSNNFKSFTWSPNGLTLYYVSSQGGWVKKDTGEHYPLRIGMPRAEAAWLNSEVIAYPDADGRKIGVYQTSAHILNLVQIDGVEPEQLHKGKDDDEVLFLAADTPMGAKSIMRLHVNTGEAERAFPWMRSAVEHFSYRPEADLVVYRELADDAIIVARGADGDEIARLPGRLRGDVDKAGRLLLTEGPGTPRPVNPEQPDGEQVVPPNLWLKDLRSGKEVLWEGVHGGRARWYDAAPGWVSFVLWGFDQRSYHRNIVLGDLGPWLASQGLGG